METRKVNGTLASALFVSAIAAIPAPHAQAQTFGGFAPQVTFPAGANPLSVAMGDLNGDGALDLAVTNQLSNNVSILRGDGAGSFAPQVTFATGIRPVSVAMGDLNGDGTPDLAVANQSSNNVSVLINQTIVSNPADFNGDGVVNAVDLATLLAQWGPCPPPPSVCATDLDGNGVVDASDLAFLLANWG